MKTITIEAPEGFEIDSLDKQTDKKTVVISLKEKPKDVLERINSDADVFADNGITEEQFFESCKGLDEDETAARFIKLLRKSMHGGEDWIPQDGQYRYEPRFMGGSSGFRYDDCDHWFSSSYVGSRLAFKESRFAIHAGTKFTKWYKQIIYPQLKKAA